MDADDIEEFDIDAMEPIDNDNDNTHSSPYLNHLVIPIKQIVATTDDISNTCKGKKS